MEELFSLIQCLTTREWESLQNYLTCFSTHANDEGGPKQLQLARILKQESECPSDNRCSLKIYGVKEGNGFDMLKSRLKEKILDFLLTDISVDKKSELDEADYVIIKMKKKSAQFQQLFYSKKRISLLYGLLDEIIFLSKEYEQYSMLVEHLRLRKTLVSWKMGGEAFDKAHMNMEDALFCFKLANRAEHCYYELMMIGDFSSRQDKEKILSNLQNNITEIGSGLESAKHFSPIVQYYLKNLEMSYYQLKEDYIHSRSVCLELLNIVRNNKSVYRRQRLGVVYDNLSRCEFYVGNLHQASECAREAQKHFNQGSENYCIALEQEFYAMFAMKAYGKSTEIATEMISSATRKELGEFRFSKYNYLLANTLFMQRKFDGVFTILSKEREMSKDKAGWEIGARLLTIMTLIETLKLDEARLAVFSLREFLKYTDKKTPVSKRDKTILNLLLILERAGFMFSTLNGSSQKHLVALGSSDGKTRWEPFTHELIPFHEWFAGKMKTKKKDVPVQEKSSVKVSVRG